jgi:transcriptional regulator with XRE-family HTH domain
MKPIQMTFTKHFIAMRKHMNYTQEEYAQLFGLTRSNIDSYENGRANVSIKLLPSFLDKFKIPKKDTFEILFNPSYKIKQ